MLLCVILKGIILCTKEEVIVNVGQEEESGEIQLPYAIFEDNDSVVIVEEEKVEDSVVIVEEEENKEVVREEEESPSSLQSVHKENEREEVVQENVSEKSPPPLEGEGPTIVPPPIVLSPTPPSLFIIESTLKLLKDSPLILSYLNTLLFRHPPSTRLIVLNWYINNLDTLTNGLTNRLLGNGLMKSTPLHNCDTTLLDFLTTLNLLITLLKV